MAKKKQKLPESLTTVTTFSKLLAMVIFITFPLFFLYVGLRFNPNISLVKENAKNMSGITAESSFITYDCQINIDLSNGQTIYVDTGYVDDSIASAKLCYQFVNNLPSPSGKMVVFNDISGGIDSKLSLYSVDNSKVYTVGNWGTSDLVDFAWTNDDRLAVLYGWKQEPESYHLSLYDLSDWDSLQFDEYGYLLNEPVDLPLPELDKSSTVRYVDNKLTVGTAANSKEVELP